MKRLLLLRFLRLLGGAGKDIEDEAKFSWKPRAIYAGMGILLLVLAGCSAIIAGLAWGASHGVAVGGSLVVAWFVIMLLLQWALGLFVHEARGRGVIHMTIALTFAIGLGVLVSWMNAMLFSQIVYKAEITQKIEKDFRHDRNALQQKQDTLLAKYDSSVSEKRTAAAAAVAKVSTAGSGEIAKLQTERNTVLSQYTVAQREQNEEAAGRRRANSSGCGTICKTMEANLVRTKDLLDQADKRLEEATTRRDQANKAEVELIRTTLKNDEAKLKADYDAANKLIANDIVELEAIDRYGFYNKQQAVLRLYFENPTAILPMQILFLFVETGFIILTLAFSGNEYAAHWRLKENAKREEQALQHEEVARNRRNRELTALAEEEAHHKEISHLRSERSKAQLAELDAQIQVWKSAQRTDAEITVLRRQWMKDHGLNLKIVG